MRRLPVVLRPGEDGWIMAECPVIPGCVSQGRTRDEALANIREAIALCLETRTAEGWELPFTEGFDTRDLQDAKALLEELR